jgi:hypothetical protein
MQSIICILENCYLASRHRPFRVKMTQEPDGVAGRAQPAVAATAAGRSTGRLELELVAAFKKQSLLPPWIDSSCLWSDSTKACSSVAAASAAVSWWWLLPAAAAWCVLISACLCGGGRRGVGDASICSSFSSTQRARPPLVPRGSGGCSIDGAAMASRRRTLVRPN